MRANGAIDRPLPIEQRATVSEAENLSARRLDPGGPLILRRPEDAARGFGVATWRCDNPKCECTRMGLGIRAFERDATGEQRPVAGELSAEYDASTDMIEVESSSAEPLAADDASWVLSQLRGEQLPWLRERWRRMSGQIRGETGDVPSTWRPGDLILYADAFPFDWDLMFSHDGRAYVVFDEYCANPQCSCESAAVELVDGSDHGRRVGVIRLEGDRVVDTKLEGELATVWRAFLAEHGQRTIRERRRQLRELAAEHAPRPQPQRSAPKIGRNELCFCGSGRKYKRCCYPALPELASR